MVKALSVLQTPTFKNAVRKLKRNQKTDLDLAFLRVHKFKMNKQLTLLGYSFDDGALVLELMAQGSHENFYRDIKGKK